jgi:hypothetical protein
MVLELLLVHRLPGFFRRRGGRGLALLTAAAVAALALTVSLALARL